MDQPKNKPVLYVGRPRRGGNFVVTYANNGVRIKKLITPAVLEDEKARGIYEIRRVN